MSPRPPWLRAWRSQSRRRKATVVGTAAFVVLLATVIFWLAAFGAPHGGDGTQVTTTTWTPQQESADLTAKGYDALAAGDATAAAELFSRAVSLDPANQNARDGLSSVTVDAGGDSDDGSDDGGGSGSGDSSDGGGGSAGEDGAFAEPVSDLTALLPKGVTGYELSLATALGPDATVAADPVAGGPVGKVVHALYSVHDAGSVTKAGGYIDAVARKAFPTNPADVTVDGVAGYFGTDGTRFASVVFARGRYVFQVILTASSGSPGTLLDLTVAAARAFPDSL